MGSGYAFRPGTTTQHSTTHPQYRRASRPSSPTSRGFAGYDVGQVSGLATMSPQPSQRQPVASLRSSRSPTVAGPRRPSTDFPFQRLTSPLPHPQLTAAHETQNQIECAEGWRARQAQASLAFESTERSLATFAQSTSQNLQPSTCHGDREPRNSHALTLCHQLDEIRQHARGLPVSTTNQ